MKKVILRSVAAAALFATSAQALELSIDGTKDGYLTNTHVFNGFGCTGENQLPKLEWKGVPKGTKSIALTVYDPDAPTGGGWWHWVAFNLPADITSIDADKLGETKGAVESITSFGKPGWGGPCPPEGDTPHRYVFTVYALKVDKLDLDANATPNLVGYMLNANSLATATATVLYGR